MARGSRRTTVRLEEERDIDAVRSVVALAFGGDLADPPPEVALVDRLRGLPSAAGGLSLVAEVGGRVVGHLLFTPCTVETDGGHVPALALAPLSVLAGHERERVGTALMRHGLAACATLPYDVVIVLGHPTYYRRFGFQPAHLSGIRPPLPWPPEAFAVLELRPGALADIEGVVRYPAPFLGL